MKILFLSLSKFENLEEKQIYNDIFKVLATKGHKIKIVCPTVESSYSNKFKNIEITRVNIGEIRNVNKIKKGIKTLTLERKFEKIINKEVNLEDIDIVMYSTPPITFNKIVKNIKSNNKNIISILILKDIFPQNAVDLGYFRKNSLIYKYFSRREKLLYKQSDLIGCMSPGNIEYILNHNKYIDPSKLFLFRNSLFKNSLLYDEKDKAMVFDNYNLSKEKITFIYGGNLGKPQHFEGIKYFIENFHRVPNGQLIIIGNGTEYSKIEDVINKTNNPDIHLGKKVSKLEFDKVLKYSDVGLVFLDPRFTIPNFPSRFSSYLDFEKPVLASIDHSTDLGEIIEENNVGFWNNAEDYEKLIQNAIKITDKDIRMTQSKNAKLLFERDYDIEVNVSSLLREVAQYEKRV